MQTQGIDSVVGRYSGAGFEVSFDYGWYSNPMDGDEYAHRWVVIGSEDARLATRPGFVGTFFPAVRDTELYGKPTRLMMHARMDEADADRAEAMLRSITFP